MKHDKNNHEGYIYALRFKWLTAVYDLFVGATMRERRFKSALIRQAHIREGSTILDVGCGTATLTVMIKNAHPDATVYGVDGDPAILARAADKASREGVQLSFKEAMSDSLPYPDGHFDRVFSSLMFHHLTTDKKVATLKEIYRVLKKGGALFIADFGRPSNLMMKIIFSIIRILDSPETTLDNVKGLIPARMESAGFKEVAVTYSLNTVFGTVCFYRGEKR
ncbi:MAG: methyltransferase domain-containing protein [Spirochaetes bacterium]|nr:MAG: methyltransferase domain-containing protein [Spirochaetota bacterium]